MEGLKIFKEGENEKDLKNVLENNFAPLNKDESLEKDLESRRKEMLSELSNLKKKIDFQELVLNEYNIRKSQNIMDENMILSEDLIKENNITLQNIKSLKEEYAILKDKYHAIFDDHNTDSFSLN